MTAHGRTQLPGLLHGRSHPDHHSCTYPVHPEPGIWGCKSYTNSQSAWTGPQRRPDVAGAGRTAAQASPCTRATSAFSAGSRAMGSARATMDATSLRMAVSLVSRVVRLVCARKRVSQTEPKAYIPKHGISMDATSLRVAVGLVSSVMRLVHAMESRY